MKNLLLITFALFTICLWQACSLESLHEDHEKLPLVVADPIKNEFTIGNESTDEYGYDFEIIDESNILIGLEEVDGSTKSKKLLKASLIDKDDFNQNIIIDDARGGAVFLERSIDDNLLFYSKGEICGFESEEFLTSVSNEGIPDNSNFLSDCTPFRPHSFHLKNDGSYLLSSNLFFLANVGIIRNISLSQNVVWSYTILTEDLGFDPLSNVMIGAVEGNNGENVIAINMFDQDLTFSDIVIFKINSRGEVVSGSAEKIENKDENGKELVVIGKNIIKTNSGTYMLTATVQNSLSGPTTRMALIELDNDLKRKSSAIFDLESTGDSTPKSIENTSDGGFIITGYSSKGNNNTDKDVFLLKVNSSLSASSWSIKYYGGAGDDEGNAVKQMEDGGYVIVGTKSNLGNTNVYVIKTDSEGNIN